MLAGFRGAAPRTGWRVRITRDVRGSHAEPWAAEEEKAETSAEFGENAVHRAVAEALGAD